MPAQVKRSSRSSLMNFELGFLDEALKEWNKLDSSTREQFKKKLAERLMVPRVPSAELSGHKDRYKIKLRSVGYRLVYRFARVNSSWWWLLSASVNVTLSTGQPQSDRCVENRCFLRACL